MFAQITKSKFARQEDISPYFSTTNNIHQKTTPVSICGKKRMRIEVDSNNSDESTKEIPKKIQDDTIPWADDSIAISTKELSLNNLKRRKIGSLQKGNIDLGKKQILSDSDSVRELNKEEVKNSFPQTPDKIHPVRNLDNQDYEAKKIEFLGDLIRDEFRTDYLSNKIFKKKVEEIYQKFNDFQTSLEEKYSDIEKDQKETPVKISKEATSCESHPTKENIIPSSELCLPSLIMFTGPDIKSHRRTEDQLIKYLSAAKKKVYVCTYSIGNGVLSIDLAKRL
ncbi:unnamed protein product [Moneuplotes crassus]|uniref:Uncharacterized protein n=1 Tax=Euplotes crassus TaxID=5936 RepID=A0AAD1UCJ7_EUPCR|nr:unnamed protein product [Moneuplotes crassus]